MCSRVHLASPAQAKDNVPSESSDVNPSQILVTNCITNTHFPQTRHKSITPQRFTFLGNYGEIFKTSRGKLNTAGINCSSFNNFSSVKTEYIPRQPSKKPLPDAILFSFLGKDTNFQSKFETYSLLLLRHFPILSLKFYSTY